jgi:hypothetical protein
VHAHGRNIATQNDAHPVSITLADSARGNTHGDNEHCNAWNPTTQVLTATHCSKVEVHNRDKRCSHVLSTVQLFVGSDSGSIAAMVHELHDFALINP